MVLGGCRLFLLLVTTLTNCLYVKKHPKVIVLMHSNETSHFAGLTFKKVHNKNTFYLLYTQEILNAHVKVINFLSFVIKPFLSAVVFFSPKKRGGGEGSYYILHGKRICQNKQN